MSYVDDFFENAVFKFRANPLLVNEVDLFPKELMKILFKLYELTKVLNLLKINKFHGSTLFSMLMKSITKLYMHFHFDFMYNLA